MARGAYTELLVLIGDTRTVVDEIHIVGNDGVTGVLGDETDGDDDSQPPSVTLRLHEVKVARLLTGRLLHIKSLTDFAEFELDGSVLIVAIRMVLGENGEGFVIAVL